jgi:hypothetical protein
MKHLPTGECWCGCGTETSLGAFFASGHDKRAESAVIKIMYEDVPNFLVKHHFGPGERNASAELAEYQKNGGKYL